MKASFNFQEVERKWQKIWAEERVFEVREDPSKPKYYLLEMYPYPSGRIHMGHVRNYSIGDVIARYKSMNGLNVIHPIGWDALGMPAENAAIKHGVHPRKWTLDNIAVMRDQLKKMGFGYDWSREVNTCLPDYYKWNQWFFLKMFERGLAFRKESWVNWCSQCRTVLANEQVVGGGCWRCGTPAIQKKMEQWFLKITEYAEELLSGHERLGKWPEHVLLMQKNWIGKSRGAMIDFPVPSLARTIEVFTTRIDTIYGATFLVISPEHPMAQDLIAASPRREEFKAWIAKAVADARTKRGFGEDEKEGIDTGVRAVNPFTGEPVPVWVANYVLMDYGTGAIMAVPAHDQRDYEFAQKHGLRTKPVIVPAEGSAEKAEEGKAFETTGRLRDSGPFTGLRSEEAMDKMGAYAEEKKIGRRSTTFRLRDWGISRQRYWGTPIPVVTCPKCGTVGIPYEDLPVEIPHDVVITGEEGSPLERLESFVRTTCPRCGGKARRETDTMDTFVDSSWYFFRYTSPREEKLPFRPEAADYWLPVDLYIGGVEHAILHLIYSRFFTKVLRDLGLTRVSEPFPHYLAQGMVIKDGSVMSKSKGNIVDPDEILKKFGADALRLFIIFASPPDREFTWAEEGLEGSYRFLVRVWTIVHENLDVFAGGAPGLPNDLPAGGSIDRVLRKMHQTIKKVGGDIEVRFHLNTAVSSIMELYNLVRKETGALRQSAEGKAVLRSALEALVQLLSPFSPHIAEELWEKTGHAEILIRTPWPAFDPALAREETVTIVVQVNGKVRDKFEAVRELSDKELEREALRLPKVRAALGGRPARKVICVKDKLVSIVI